MAQRSTPKGGKARAWLIAGWACVCALIAGLTGAADAAGRPPEVTAVSARDAGQGAAISVSLSGAVRAAPFLLDNPNRLVIDLPGAQLAQGARLTDGAGLIARIRHGVLPRGGVRLVLDLGAPVRLVPMNPANGGARFEVQVQPLRPPVSAVRAPAKAVAAAPTPPPGSVRLSRFTPARKPVIVIDAGHGGRDPGAIGRRLGVQEKDITLRAARLVRDQLLATGRFEVVLTRDSDRYLELEDRVRIARAANADLFISLHADSNPNPNARGVSVYTLSERGVGRARRLADRHDWELDLDGEERPAVVSDILMDLTQRETTNRSADFAGLLIPRLSAVTPLLRNTHRNAGFFVLLAPDVPAVLIELGFLTNPLDETRLTDLARLQRKARAICLAVDDYFAPRRIAVRG
jgi:N-acetylmuramoyl-L-alanine amidase